MVKKNRARNFLCQGKSFKMKAGQMTDCITKDYSKVTFTEKNFGFVHFRKQKQVERKDCHYNEIVENLLQMKNAVSESSLLWPDAAVIYRLDRRIGTVKRTLIFCSGANLYNCIKIKN